MTIRLHVGDCRAILAAMPAESVHCVVTSPPYWGLRDYGVSGQLGLEATPEEYLEHMVAVFRDVRRVLRADGTLWLNLGDCYHNGDKGGYARNRVTATDSLQASNLSANFIGAPNRMPHATLKPKDLVGIPWRLALALQADGWWLRRDIIWAKPAPMPESTRDRPTTAHEYVFLLSKAERYYYDADAIAEPCSPNTHLRVSQDVANQKGSARANGGTRPDRPMKSVLRGVNPKAMHVQVAGWAHRPGGHDAIAHATPRPAAVDDTNTTKFGRRAKMRPSAPRSRQNPSFSAAISGGRILTRNKRSVWTIPAEPFRGAHFATFPCALAEPCILAGSPEGGTVLDPFAGSGTVGLVAARHHRSAQLIELSAEYATLAAQRIRAGLGLFCDLEVSHAQPADSP